MIADRGYGFAWFAAYRFNSAQTEVMLDDVMDKLRANPPSIERIAHVTYPDADVGRSTADQDGARRAAARLEYEARYIEIRNLILGFASPPSPDDVTYRADWLKGLSSDDQGNPTYQQPEPMLKYVEFNLTVAPDGAAAHPPQVPAAASKAGRVMDCVRSLFRKRDRIL